MIALSRRSGRCLGRLLALLAAVALHAARAAASDGSAARGEGPAIAIATGSPVGVYFSVGNAICRLVERSQGRQPAAPAGPMPCSPTATGGSSANVEQLRNGNVNFAILQSDVLFRAHDGSGAYAERRLERLRSVLSLHGEPFQLLVGRNSGIEGFGDLKGRKVGSGEAGTAQARLLTDLVRAHATDDKWLGRTVELSVVEQLRAICDEDVDALGMMIGFPNSGYTAAMRRCGAHIIDVDSPATRKLVGERPYFARIVIPKDSYPTMRADVTTFGVMAVLATRAETPDGMVEAVVRSIFEQIADLRAMHPSLAGLDVGRMARDGLIAPLHPVAEQFYRSRKWR